MTRNRPKIVFLDDSEDLRELMPIVLQTMLGVDCMCFASVMEMENQADEVLRAKVAILDINLGPNVPDGIDAFHWLKKHGFQGKIFFLTGHARTHPQLALAQTNGVEIFEKPLHPDKLISFVSRALNETT